MMRSVQYPRLRRIAALAVLLTAAVATAAGAQCDYGADDGDDLDAEYEQIIDEIGGMAPVRELDLRIGQQRIFRIRPYGLRGADDPLVNRLRAMKPRIEDLQTLFEVPPTRPVLIVETRTDTFPGTIAIVDCVAAAGDGPVADHGARLAQHYLSERYAALADLPAGLCLMVVYPDRLDGSDLDSFVLAHEWAHTMQSDAYTRQTMQNDWWVEGSAEWFAHMTVPGVTGRDNVIGHFFEKQPGCSLIEHSYDVQPFFFWGGKVLDPSWVVSVGLGGRRYLGSPSGAAQILPPDRWLDWAVAQAEQTITMPDDRPLPAQAQARPVDLRSSCVATIDGPPLSVQLRSIALPEGIADPIRVDAGDAQVALRGQGGDWIRMTGEAEITPPPSPIQIAAIAPSGRGLSVDLTLGEGTTGACPCYVGRWMEVRAERTQESDELALMREMIMEHAPAEDRAEALGLIEDLSTSSDFRFRAPRDQPMGEGTLPVVFNNVGPLLTILADGRFWVDDPYRFETEEDDFRVILDQFRERRGGSWDMTDGRLTLDVEYTDRQGLVTQQDFTTGWTHTGRSDYQGGPVLADGGMWTASCSPGGLTLTEARHVDGGGPRQVVNFVRP